MSVHEHITVGWFISTGVIAGRRSGGVIDAIRIMKGGSDNGHGGTPMLFRVFTPYVDAIAGHIFVMSI